ncbi:hypothetical protein V0M98_33365 (plasmid) [Pseudomonas silesiensis]|uniref:hypothetical protein n=1 Tax=Pseudomonas silesiensis TaxID=1853130 RepID=UPI0030CB1AA2
MDTTPAIWKPTQDQCWRIKFAAAQEAGLRVNQIKLQPGVRLNMQDHSVESSINIARVTRHTNGSWEDTDLDDRIEWRAFKKGVPLTEDGRAIVDFYIHRYGIDGDLEGNVVVFFENGELSRIKGYGIKEHSVR